MAHLDVDLLAIVVFDDADWLADGVLTCWHNLDDSTIDFWAGHNMMVLEKSIFSNVTNDITSTDQITNINFSAWVEIPKFVLIEARQFDTSWDENVLSESSNGFEWSLNTIENCFQDTWS